jgi:DNA-directed RNA polymerase subunit beta'
MKKNKEEFKIYGEIMNQSGYIPLIKMMDEVIYYLPTILGSSERRLIGHPRKGGEIIQAALEELDLNELIKTGREEIIRIRTIGRAQIIAKATLRRIRISESFLSTGTKPEWMMLTVLPVLPPSLRPFVELGNGKLVAADLNELYRLIITRNQRLFDFIYVSNLPNLISIYARKLLQESVDSLIDNGKLPKNKIIYLNNNPLKSLTEVLEGKQGRFRHSLLGKRVDYSGRSVIIVNPLLRLNQCGLPYDMAKELFQPFLVNELIRHIMKVHNTKLAQVIIKRNKPAVWRILKKLSRSRSVLLNRAPTLHRFGIQAFDPIIVLEQSIHLHPLVCTGFNADFDGDQMAIHMPLYESSQLEAKYMMRPSYNILTPTNGDVILKPTQDMVIGCYYLTFMISNHPNLFKRCFSNESEVLRAFYQKKIDLHTPIFLKYSVSEFKLKIEKNELFLKLKDNYHLNYQKVIIYKKFQNKEKNYYFITNLGIFIAKNFLNQFVELTTLLFETTTGRLIFNKNVKEALQGTIENKDYIDKAYTEVEISQNINTENS